MAALLNVVRNARANGYVLWQALAHVCLGREPTPVAARAMASRLLVAYSAAWPRDAATSGAGAIDALATRVLESLARKTYGELTSARPALVAYMLDRMGDAHRGVAGALAFAQRAVVQKLLLESTRDTASALSSVLLSERRLLREVAMGALTFDELDRRFGAPPSSMPEFIAVLSEAGSGGDAVRLQPPYAALLLSWIATDGQLAVAVDGDDIDLPLVVRRNFVCISENRAAIGRDVKASVSVAVLASLAANRLGFAEANGTVRPPATAAEFDSVPAFVSLRTLLDSRYLQGNGREPSLSRALQRAAEGATRPATAATFSESVGWELLLSFRHFEAHIWDKVPQLTRHGLTASAIVDAHRAAVHVLAATHDSPLQWHSTSTSPVGR